MLSITETKMQDCLVKTFSTQRSHGAYDLFPTGACSGKTKYPLMESGRDEAEDSVERDKEDTATGCVCVGGGRTHLIYGDYLVGAHKGGREGGRWKRERTLMMLSRVTLATTWSN